MNNYEIFNLKEVWFYYSFYVVNVNFVSKIILDNNVIIIVVYVSYVNIVKVEL